MLGSIAAIPVLIFFSPAKALLFLISSVLLDIDHFAWYAVRFKDTSVANALRFFDGDLADKHYCLCVLHTFELIALYLAACFNAGSLFKWCAAGALFHMLADALQSFFDGGLLRRRWSIAAAIAYALRNEKKA